MKKLLNSPIILLIVTPFVSTGINSLIKMSGTDSLLTILISFIIGISYIYIFCTINNYKKDVLLIDKIKLLFNKPIAYIIIIILFLTALIIASNRMFGIVNYTSSQFLNKTPILFIGIIFTLLIIYLNYKGTNTIIRLSKYIFIFNTILLVLAIIGLAPHIEISNLKPMFITNFNSLFKNALYIICIDLLPIFILLNIENNLTKKNICLSYLYSFLVLFIIMFSILGVMGIYLLRYYQYPAYISLQYVNLFNFINRVENVLNIQWILGLFVSTTLLCNYLSRHFNKKVFRIIIPVIVFIIPIILFKNISQFNNFAFKYYPYIGGSIFITNLIIFIKIKIDQKIYSVN